MNLKSFGIFFFAAGLAVSGSAQITKQGSGYLLRVKYTAGKSMSYTMKASGSAQGQAFSMTTPMKMKVVSVKGKNGTLDYSVGPMSMMVNGKPMNMGGSNVTKVTATIDDRGKMIKSSAGQNPGGSITFPEKPIAVGGTWSGTTTVNAGASGPMTVSAKYKLVGIQNMNGIPAAKITLTLNGSGASKVTGTGTVYLAMSDGSLIRNDNKMQISMAQLPKPMQMTMSIYRN